jgi:hypothetical protein
VLAELLVITQQMVVTDLIQYFQQSHLLVAAVALLKIVLQEMIHLIEKVMTEDQVVEEQTAEGAQALVDQVIHLLSVRLKEIMVAQQQGQVFPQTQAVELAPAVVVPEQQVVTQTIVERQAEVERVFVLK